MKNKLFYFGILSPLFYLAAVVIGGILWPEYSHIRQPISELSADFAPNMLAVDLLFFLANLSGLLFGIGVFILGSREKRKIVKAVGSLLIISGVVSLLFYFFPQDPIGAKLTFKGLVHFILAGASSILTMAIVFTSTYAFKFIKKFSMVMGFMIVISGFFTVYAATNLPAIFGIFERITIGSYMLWLFTVSITLVKSK